VDDEYVGKALTEYFPTLMRQKYPDAIARHALRREIISTVVANTMINRTGSIFVHRMQEETGASPEEVVRAFILVRDIYGLDPLWREIDGLDNQVPAALQYELLVNAGRVLLRAVLWFLRRRREKLAIGQVLDIFRPSLEVLQRQVPGVLAGGDRVAWEAYVARLGTSGVPKGLAERLAGLESLYAVLDVTEVAGECRQDLEAIAAVYFAIVGELDLRWIAEKITALPTDTSWQALARNALRDDLASQQRSITQAIAKMSPDERDPARMLAAWKERYAPAIQRLESMVKELKALGTLDLAVLSVLLRELRGLA
jgi:glutamate dehydrogenase